MRTAFIDADIIVWKAAVVGQTQYEMDGESFSMSDWPRMWATANRMVHNWAAAVESDQFVVCATDRGEGCRSFRFDLFDAYHANRAAMVRPDLFLQLHWELVSKYHAVYHPGLEGDDIIGILATSGDYEDPVIVTEDKDFFSIPNVGVFSPRRSKSVKQITPQQADMHWFYQALVGDVADNYKGCHGIGDKKARALLYGAQTVEDLWGRALPVFLQHGHTEDYAIQQLRMARILRNEDIDNEWTTVKLWAPTGPEPFRLPEPQSKPLSASGLRVS